MSAASVARRVALKARVIAVNVHPAVSKARVIAPNAHRVALKARGDRTNVRPADLKAQVIAVERAPRRFEGAGDRGRGATVVNAHRAGSKARVTRSAS